MAEYVSRGSAGRAIMLAAFVIAAIIVLHIIFVLVGANAGNTIVSTDADWSNTLAACFTDLFTPGNYKLAVFLNLVVGRIVAGLVGAL
jgi:hypothetical protein